MEIDAVINDAFAKLADLSESIAFYSYKFTVGSGEAASEHSLPLILVWLAAAAVFFTLYLGFVNVRHFTTGIRLLFRKTDDKADGQIGSWQALAASLSGTVGLGNIAGVAVAVSVGGPGAVMWMMLMGILGMSTKYAEVYMGVKYRHHADDEHPDKVSGGPMYYLRDWFSNKNIPHVGPFLGGFFAVLCILGAIGGGNMFQANQSYMQFLNVVGGEASFWADKGWLFGIILAVLVGVVIIGGIKSIARVSSALVPVMGGIYLLAGLVVIGMNLDTLPHAIGVIVDGAFTPEAGLGALVGAILTGVQRASFSNEAGLGSAAIVYSAVKTEQPVEQGLIGMLGPFIDTVVICMITALVIVVTGAYESGVGVEGVQLTSRAMGEELSWMPYVLVLTVFLFAYSTLITWSYYGEKAIAYLFGEKDIITIGYKIVFCAFVIVGCSSSLTNVIRFTDAAILSMAIPNLIGLYFMAPEIKRDLKNYLQSTDKKEEIKQAA